MASFLRHGLLRRRVVRFVFYTPRTNKELKKVAQSDCEKKYGHISTWRVARIADMSAIFCDARAFNQPVRDWDTSNVTNMEAMFCGARLFKQPVGDWNTSNVKNMYFMFH